MSTLLSNASSCFLVIFIFTSVGVAFAFEVVEESTSDDGKSKRSLSSSVMYFGDDCCFKQFPIFGFGIFFCTLSLFVSFWNERESERILEKGESWVIYRGEKLLGDENESNLIYFT